MKVDLANIDFSQGLFILIALYLIGIFVDELVYRFYKLVRLFKKKKDNTYTSKNSMSLPEKYAILRVQSKENFTYIEYWNSLKGMCRNLAFTGLFIVICSVIDLIVSGYTLNIVVIIITAALFSYLMVIRAKIYRDFANSELDSSIDTLK